MKKISTPLTTTREEHRIHKNEMRPRRTTIEAIRQFARSYSYEQQLPGELGNMFAN